ncbi:hypothetical protein EVAR_14642_1 [Eumeta japonica]|uniref:Uncharacterized protein n=1 Tax=Eumeta variegata TaxID=151549 RepID=A0A4C1U200_EUMVA|nr:hypothetical protein EVAR_14642_1 [Eumeta japonica]
MPPQPERIADRPRPRRSLLQLAECLKGQPRFRKLTRCAYIRFVEVSIDTVPLRTLPRCTYFKYETVAADDRCLERDGHI